jgi:serine/threonine-protein phosphatase 2A regulatory subunit A
MHLDSPEEVIELVTQELDKTTSSRENRLSAVRALPSVGKVLGAVDVREKLIPLVLSIAPAEEDEVQFAIAEILENYVPVVGGGEYAHLILKILEAMCSAEETVVRDRTAKAFSKVVTEMQWSAESSTICLEILSNLSKGAWFTEKVLASNMYAAVYLK